jgi:hypothetical protein
MMFSHLGGYLAGRMRAAWSTLQFGGTSHGTGAALLGSGLGPNDLLSMKVNVTLAAGMYFYACAQIGTLAALLFGYCAVGGS